MNSRDIESKQILDRYVQGRLNDDELEAFEVYLLDHPEMIDDVRAASVLNDAKNAPPKDKRGNVNARGLGGSAGGKQPGADKLPWLSLASAACVGGIGVWMTMQLIAPFDTASSVAANPSMFDIHVYELGHTRSEQAFDHYEVKPSPGGVLLRVDMGPFVDGLAFDVSIADQSGQVVSQVTHSARDGLIHLLVADVSSGTYTLRVEDRSGELSPHTYALIVR